MKHFILIASFIVMPLSGAVADQGGKTLASTLEVYVFPTQGQAQQQGAAQQQATQEQIGNFKKAFSVCLEAKDYMVKF